MSTPSATLSFIADLIMDQFGPDLDFLKEKYESNANLSTLFDQGKRHYVEFLVALIESLQCNKANAFAIQLQLLPPLHVDVLWKFHCLELKRYRIFEENVLTAYGEHRHNTDLKHLDYCCADDERDKKVRTEMTKNFYTLYKLKFENPDEVRVRKKYRLKYFPTPNPLIRQDSSVSPHLESALKEENLVPIQMNSAFIASLLKDDYIASLLKVDAKNSRKLKKKKEAISSMQVEMIKKLEGKNFEDILSLIEKCQEMQEVIERLRQRSTFIKKCIEFLKKQCSETDSAKLEPAMNEKDLALIVIKQKERQRVGVQMHNHMVIIRSSK